MLTSVITQFPRNYLFRFELARIYADAGEKTNGIASLDRIELLLGPRGIEARDVTGQRVERG